MNLLDQKLKEKLKLFDNIDKETESKLQSTIKKPKKKLNNQLPTSNLTREQFNQIYSNFILDSNKHQQNMQESNSSISNTHSHKNSLNELKFIENKILNSGKYIKTPPKSAKSEIRSKSKDFKTNYNPPNDSGNRLYNYGFYLKNKLEKQRLQENIKIKKQMTPKILAKSKEIFRDSSFETRLYYNNNESDHNNFYKKKEISKDNSYDQLDYKPKLNKKSLQIANKLEPSSQRLMKKKKKFTDDKNKNKNIYKNIYQNHSRSNSISPSDKEYLKRCNELYNKGIENMMKREQIYKETKIKKEEEYKNYSFKPKITKNSPVVEKNTIIKSTSPSGKKNIMSDLYKKQFEWKKKLENENIKKKEKIDNQTKLDCTFKPEITHLKIQNDEKFIMKNIKQMNDYVNRRREVIEKQKEYEKYKRKRLGEDVSSFECRPTIPRKFELKTEERSRSHSKDNNYHERKNSVNRIIKDINTEREEMNTFGFFNNVPNNLGYNINNGNNNFAQQEFIDAVNALHSKIDNLNI